ncbi:MAG: hypothetical protein MUP81_00720 [Dehalococcoidia bacterium]|nr:hypothetical protein [Dehalococcoidia bacterium]
MKLSVRERLVILSVLPPEGDFITLKVVGKLKNDLSFSEDEIKLYKFVQAESSVTWDNKIEQEKAIEIGTKAKTVIAEALEKLDKEKKLREDHISIYEKFVDKGN